MAYQIYNISSNPADNHVDKFQLIFEVDGLPSDSDELRDLLVSQAEYATQLLYALDGREYTEK